QYPLLDFASGSHRPDRLQFTLTMGIVHIMQVDGGIDMARDQFKTIPYVQRTNSWQRTVLPYQNAVFIPSWPIGDAEQSSGFRHATIGGQRLETGVDHCSGGSRPTDHGRENGQSVGI